MSNKMEDKMMKPAIKSALVPNLRFPEFREAGEWEEKQLHQIAKSVSDRAIDKDKNNVLTLSGENGLILQSDYFGKKIAGDNVARYIKIALNDFVYNDRTTKLSTYGSIKRLSKYESGIVSPIYKCFRFSAGENPAFWDWYFESGFHEPQLHGLVNEGARAGRFNISIDNFLSTLVWPPKPKEQQKIASCLSSIDDLITLEAQKLATLKAHKKGLMQQLFPAEGETLPKLRFPEFRDAGEWAIKPLAKVCNVLQGYGFPDALQGKREGKYPFCKVSDISRAVAESGGLLAEATNYIGDDELLKLRAKPIPKGATVFAKIGEALRLNRRAYVRKECLIDNNATGLKAIDGVADDYFVYLLSQLIDLNKHCGGAVPSVNKSTFEQIEVVVPGSDEQKRIADCLSSIDDLITAQTQKLDTLKTHKKGLMQQLFPALDEGQG